MTSRPISMMPAEATAPQAARRATAPLIIKAALDRVIGLIGTVVTLIITPLIALILKLEDGGPVFYRSKYMGCDGKIRSYLKFRTMVRDADALLATDPELRRQFADNQKLRNDPRVLRSGRFLRKFSIDEFPQFFSLLAGELTFVGPRAVGRDEMMRYGDKLPKLFSVKPGITGYWQVNGRQNTTYEQRIQMDMYYIDHWSLRLDLVIIAKTFWKVLIAEGAY